MKKLFLLSLMATAVTFIASCSSDRDLTKEELIQKLEVYKAYYIASERFLNMVETEEWEYNNKCWSDTYYETDAGDDLAQAREEVTCAESNIYHVNAEVKMPSYNDLLEERHMLWELLQVTAVQDTVAWENVVKKTPEYEKLDRFLQSDWEDMEYWKYKPVNLKYEELSEE